MKRIFLKGWTNGDIVLNITLKYLVYHHSFIYGFYDETLCEEPRLKLYHTILFFTICHRTTVIHIENSIKHS